MAVPVGVSPRTSQKVRAWVCAAVAVMSAYLLSQGIQAIAPRPRPFVVYGIVPLVGHAPDSSFPSDHAVLALSWIGIWVLASRSRWLCLVASAVAGLLLVARVYVGLHFPSDMLAGAAIGVVAALTVWRLSKPLHHLAQRARGGSTLFGG